MEYTKDFKVLGPLCSVSNACASMAGCIDVISLHFQEELSDMHATWRVPQPTQMFCAEGSTCLMLIRVFEISHHHVHMHAYMELEAAFDIHLPLAKRYN
jgi:hypothetical protein